MNVVHNLNILYNEYKREFEGHEIVLGDGEPSGKLVLVGEAPGRQEVEKNRPFVGMAGKNLMRFLENIGYDRSEIFITNAIKYRLSKLNPKTRRIVNRPANRDDINLNYTYLQRELEILTPHLIVTLGNIPLKMIYEKKAQIGEHHGTLLETTIGSKKFNVFPLYHPASVIYNRSLEIVYLEDLERLRELLNEPLEI